MLALSSALCGTHSPPLPFGRGSVEGTGSGAGKARTQVPVKNETCALWLSNGPAAILRLLNGKADWRDAGGTNFKLASPGGWQMPAPFFSPGSHAERISRRGHLDPNPSPPRPPTEPRQPGRGTVDKRRRPMQVSPPWRSGRCWLSADMVVARLTPRGCRRTRAAYRAP